MIALLSYRSPPGIHSHSHLQSNVSNQNFSSLDGFVFPTVEVQTSKCGKGAQDNPSSSAGSDTAHRPQ